jgi:hypothetical protein
MGDSNPMMAIPFRDFRSGTIKPQLQAMISVRAMLSVVDRCAASVTPDDLVGIFGSLVDKPTPDQLPQISQVVKSAAANAALVFMHAAYENAVYDLMRNLVRYDPTAWVVQIQNKQVAFTNMDGMTTAQIRDRLLEEWLAKVEKETFPKKVELVLGVLKGATPKDVIDDFDFDMGKFKEIDKARHDCAHRPNFNEAVPDPYARLRYLHCTVLMLERLAEQKYPGQPLQSLRRLATPT